MSIWNNDYKKHLNDSISTVKVLYRIKLMYIQEEL